MPDQDPALTRVEQDLDSIPFRAGTRRGFWRRQSFEFPVLFILVKAMGWDGTESWYRFKFGLGRYPGQAPSCRLWELGSDREIRDENRPRKKNPDGSLEMFDPFKPWQESRVYRPWEKEAGPHLDAQNKYPHLAWRPDRDLTFVLEDIYERLNRYVPPGNP
jgi:hypothetical protein